MPLLFSILFAASFLVLVIGFIWSLRRRWTIQSSAQFRQDSFYHLTDSEVEAIVKTPQTCRITSRAELIPNYSPNGRVVIDNDQLILTMPDGTITLPLAEIKNVSSQSYSHLAMSSASQKFNLVFGDGSYPNLTLFYKLHPKQPVRGKGYEPDLKAVAFFLYLQKLLNKAERNIA